MKPRLQNFGLWKMRNAASNDGPAEILMYEDIGREPWEDTGFTAKDLKNILNGLDKGRELSIRINSMGGYVNEGLAIKSLLDLWEGKKIAIIDGVAASTASWCCLGCNEIHANKGSQMFIHDAMGCVFGNEAEMTKAAGDLCKTSNQIAQMYSDKTGKPVEEMRQKMRDETLLTGEEALDMGLIDKLTDQKATRNFTPDELGKIKNKLQALNSLTAKVKENRQQPAPTTGKSDQIMNKEKMIALLNKWGVTVPKDATDEQLTALIEAGQPVKQANELDSLKNQIDTMNNLLKEQKKVTVTAAINQLIVDDKLPEAEKEAEIALCLADEKRLAILTNRQSRPPGAAPVSASIESNASPKEVLAHFDKGFSAPMNSWKRGNDVSMKDIAAASMNKAQHLAKHKNEIIKMMNVGANTVPAGLQRNVILGLIVTDFVRRLLPLNAFSTVFSNVPLEGTNKIEIPYYDLDTSASTSWVNATGYAAGDTVTAVKEIQIGNNGGNAALMCDRKLQGLSFTSEEMARQPFLNILQLATLKAQKLAYDIVTHVQSCITAANFGAAAVTKQAALFTSDELADLKVACKAWPEMGRSLILDSAYDGALLKDQGFKFALNAASDSAVKEGRLFPRVYGFDYIENPNVPANGESLVGYAVFKSAIGFASAPVPPCEEVRNAGATYEIVTDAQSGGSFEYRTFGDLTLDTGKHFIESSYGFKPINGNALKRIVSQ